MKGSSSTLYLQVAGKFELSIKNGVLKNGDKLPSLRTVCDENGIGMNTAIQAYSSLERKGLINARPKSGYYVCYHPSRIRESPSSGSPLMTQGLEEMDEVILRVRPNRSKSALQFSSGSPGISLMPVARLNKAMTYAMKSVPDSGIGYDYDGSDNLKAQVAKRSLTWGGHLAADDVITSAGCMNGIAYSLMSILEIGDTICVESPTFYGILQLAKSLGLQVIELPSNPVSGIELDALKGLLLRGKIDACVLVSNFSNPLGSCMPDEHKKELVRLLEHHNIPLIEDDIYGDLYFGSRRPTTCKTYDQSGNVILCSSFSKTLAAGYRVGWLAPGKFKERITKTKMYHSFCNNLLSQEEMPGFLSMSATTIIYVSFGRPYTEIFSSTCAVLRHISPKTQRSAHPRVGLYCGWRYLNGTMCLTFTTRLYGTK